MLIQYFFLFFSHFAKTNTGKALTGGTSSWAAIIGTFSLKHYKHKQQNTNPTAQKTNLAAQNTNLAAQNTNLAALFINKIC